MMTTMIQDANIAFINTSMYIINFNEVGFVAEVLYLVT